MTDLTAAEAKGGGVRIAIVVAVVLAAVLEVLDSTIVNIALPHIKSAFGATTDQTTWILTSYIVAAVVVMPLTGLMARLIGRRRLILGAITGFALFSALCGISTSLDEMILFRLGQGVFGAFLIPLSQSILFDAFPREKRGQAMAMFGLGVVVAPVLGPTAGAVLTEYFSWRMVFFVNLPMALFALLMLAGELPKDEPERVRIDWTGLALMALGIGALQFLLDQGESKDWFLSPVIQVAAIAAALGLAAFLWRGLRHPEPVVDLGLLGERNFAMASLIIAGFAVTMFGGIAILPLFVQGLLGYPVLEAGYLFVPRGIAGGLSMVVVGSLLVGRVDPRILAAIGLIVTAVSNFMYGALTLEASFSQLAVPGFISGLGLGLIFVPLSTLAFDRIEQARQDDASGLYGVTRQLGSSIGIAVVGALLVRATATDTAILSAKVTPFNPAAQAYLAPLGLAPDTPEGAAILSAEIARQAALMAYSHIFNLLGVLALVLLPLLLLMQKPSGAGPRPGAGH
ncbi:DHA2 family multidrug resistance protein [Palleronia aestuarii]|uniref:DHA2 family multidrug resistance protein n=1 Tax=Palleronia aestuarii TaxID=568105 RepID=A0A2W7P0T6_9RHOB|nr:DHA2 family efflux MFS transporter permease subunit [Palleronia aestuarii]PZX17072.1 DHA2 family multidrug resistance protein [Palleronia aestuarii]